MKRTFKYLGITFGIAMAVEMCLLLIGFGNNKYVPTYSFSSPPDYTDLFNDSARHKISLHVTNLIKGRNPIAEYVYDDRISIVVYKINVPVDAPIDSLLAQGYESARRGLLKRYCAVTAGQLKMFYRCDSIGLVEKIFISYYGDSVRRIFKNRNLMSVKMLLGGLAIQYEEKGLVDLEVEKDRQKKGKIPTELTFLKQGDAVFLILSSPTFNGSIDISGFSREILNENFFR
jgi:hypothetical protein